MQFNLQYFYRAKINVTKQENMMRMLLIDYLCQINL